MISGVTLIYFHPLFLILNISFSFLLIYIPKSTFQTVAFTCSTKCIKTNEKMTKDMTNWIKGIHILNNYGSLEMLNTVTLLSENVEHMRIKQASVSAYHWCIGNTDNI